jgi:hypothetical protein
LPAKCFAVDTWQGDEQSGFYGEDIYLDFQKFHNERYAAFSTLLRCTFDDAAAQFESGSIDLLHIDGLHTYDAVRHDFENWLPKVSNRGIVLLHDTNERQPSFGVWRLWSELSALYPSFEFVHGHGLGVLATGSDACPAIRALCGEADEALIAAARERFAWAGERWIAAYKFNSLQQEQNGLLQELNALTARNEQTQSLTRIAPATL